MRHLIERIGDVMAPGTSAVVVEGVKSNLTAQELSKLGGVGEDFGERHAAQLDPLLKQLKAAVKAELMGMYGDRGVMPPKEFGGNEYEALDAAWRGILASLI
jgi:hypothetical protein